MVYRGHVENGLIRLEGPVVLPEGAEVRVELAAPGPEGRAQEVFDPSSSSETWRSAPEAGSDRAGNSRCAWLPFVRKQLQAIAALPEGWDSDGAAPESSPHGVGRKPH